MAELPPIGELRLRPATAPDGAPAELVWPEAGVMLRPRAVEQLRAAASPPSHPAVLPVLALSEVEGRPARLRPPTRPWPPASLDAAQAWERLWPAVQACRHLLGGALGAEDLVVGEDGQLWLSPSGLPRKARLVPVSGDPLEADLRALLSAPAAPSPAPLPLRHAPARPSARRDVAIAEHSALIWPAPLPAPARRRLAALLGQPLATIEEAALQGAALPLASARSAEELARRTAHLADAGLSPSILPDGSPPLPALLGAAVLLLLPLAAVPWLGPLVALAALGGVGLLTWLWSRARSLREEAEEALRRGHDLLERAAPPSAREAAYTRLRRAVLEAGLNETIRVDLLDTIDSLDQSGRRPEEAEPLVSALDQPEELPRRLAALRQA